jgi:ATP synthase regulation protein NCA2
LLSLFSHETLSNTFYHFLFFTQYYPIGLTDLKARRPSKQERYWALNAVLCGGIFYLGYVTLRHLRDGSIQKKYHSIKEHTSTVVTEHIIEPITKLGEEFFEKLHRREEIVSRKDLIQSKDALTRMLADFSKHGQRSYDIRQMMLGSSKPPSGFHDSDSTSTSSSTSTSNGSGNVLDDVESKEASLANESAAMETLMRTYEKQLQSPIYGMLYGNLMTAMLIQMQKLKGKPN